MDGRPTWTDCDEAGDYVVPNVLSPRDLVFRSDKHGRNCTTHIMEKSNIVPFSDTRKALNSSYDPRDNHVM